MGQEAKAGAEGGLSADHRIARRFRFSYAFRQFLSGPRALIKRGEVIGCESNVAG